VESLVQSLDIQVSNLCQFLPQDRVADFVKMSNTELLTNTMNAVRTFIRVPFYHGYVLLVVNARALWLTSDLSVVRLYNPFRMHVGVS